MSFLQMNSRIAARMGAVLVVGLALLAPPVASAHAAEPMPYGKGLLWKVEREGSEPSWVFGTMHVSDERVTALRKPLVADSWRVVAPRACSK